MFLEERATYLSHSGSVAALEFCMLVRHLSSIHIKFVSMILSNAMTSMMNSALKMAERGREREYM